MVRRLVCLAVLLHPLSQAPLRAQPMPDTPPASQQPEARADEDVNVFLRSLAPRPMRVLSEVRLPACAGGPQCWAAFLPKRDPFLPGEDDEGGGDKPAPRRFAVFTGKGVHLVGPTRAPLRADGYVDQRKRTWVRLACVETDSDDEDGGCMNTDTSVLSHPESPLFGICSRGDHVNTAGGFGADFSACFLFDLESRTRLLEGASRLLRVLPPKRVRMEAYFHAPPRWCAPPGPARVQALPPGGNADGLSGRVSRRGPEHAVSFFLDVSRWPPRLLEPPRRSVYSDERGQEPAGACARKLW